MVSRLSGQDGAVLIMVILCIVTASIVGVAMVDLTTTSTYSQLSTSLQDRAYYLAEAGGRYAIPLVTEDIENEVTTNTALLHNQTFTLDDDTGTNGRFLVEVDTTSDPDYVFVHVTGSVNTGGYLMSQSKVTYRLAQTIDSPFQYGGFGGNKIKVKDDATIDGDVATNKESDKIDVEDDAVITGDQDAEVGITLGDVSFPSGSYTSDLNMEEETQTFAAGTYNYKKVTMKEDVVLNISGDVTINAKEEWKMEKNAKIVILADSSLTIYLNDKVEIVDESEVNADGDAADVLMFMCRNKDLKIKDSAIVNAGIYAPQSTKVTIEGDAQITGALVGKEIELKDDVVLTYSDTLEDVATPGSGSTLSDPVQYYST